MQHETVSGALTQKAFDFFFWFSRFEAALKESGFLKSEAEGDVAEPSWEKFIGIHADQYEITDSGRRLLELAPERQIVGLGKRLTWRQVDVGNCQSELCKVVRMLKTLRNNVFHGGKSGGAGWDQPDRTADLLDNGIKELHALAGLAGLEEDLWQKY